MDTSSMRVIKKNCFRMTFKYFIVYLLLNAFYNDFTESAINGPVLTCTSNVFRLARDCRQLL